MTNPRALSCLDGGRSVLVGSVDADGAPACCRGIAVRSDDDLASVTLYVPVATSQQVLANLATTRRIAVVTCEIISHSTTQIKGITANVRLASESEREFVRNRLEEFADTLDDVGLPRRITRTLNHWPAFAIEIDVREIFDQTPGPNAGAPIP